jgi:DNA topoisomerase VI subunit B
MRQMAVITPYAQFQFKFVSDAPEYVNISIQILLSRTTMHNHIIPSIFFCSKNVTVRFSRRTDVMPPIPLETKHHPSSVDLLLIKRLIAETSKQNLLQFLQHEFVNISKPHAERLIGMKNTNFINNFFEILCFILRGYYAFLVKGTFLLVFMCSS